VEHPTSNIQHPTSNIQHPGTLFQSNLVAFDIVVRIVVGAFLVIGATGKLIGFVSDPIYSVPFVGRFGGVVLIQLELAIGMHVLANQLSQVSLWLCIMLFAGFTVASGWLTFAGMTNCGCLGKVAVHPSVMFVVDISILSALGVLATNGLNHVTRKSRFPPSFSRWLLGTVSLLFLGIFFSLSHAGQSLLFGTESITAKTLENQYIVIDTTGWVGNRFPYEQYLSEGKIPDDVTHGVIVHAGCGKCQQLVGEWSRLELDERDRRLVVEIPDHALPSVPHELQSSSLDSRLRWYAQTPIVFRLDRGIVGNCSIT
jgi:hypothetical protein